MDKYFLCNQLEEGISIDSLIQNGDTSAILVSGRRELLQRVWIQLTAHRGEFPYCGTLGSRLYQIAASDSKCEQKVLEAFREVNDAVVTYRNVRTAAALKRDLQQAAQKYVELAQLQYFNGVINYLDVLDAQRKYFDAQIGLSNAVRDEHLAMVDLYKALGGGWGVERE